MMSTSAKIAVLESPAQSPMCGKYGQYVNTKCWYTAKKEAIGVSLDLHRDLCGVTPRRISDSHPKWNKKMSMMNWNICIVVRCFFHCGQGRYMRNEVIPMRRRTHPKLGTTCSCEIVIIYRPGK